MEKETCQKCGNTQFYLERLPPLYLFDESRAMVCGECGYMPSSGKYKKEADRERRKLLEKEEKCEKCNQPLCLCVHIPIALI